MTTIASTRRYRILYYEKYTLLLRDDGYRIHMMILEPQDNSAVGEWVLWADYKQCEIPFIAELVATTLMTGEPPGGAVPR